ALSSILKSRLCRNYTVVRNQAADEMHSLVESHGVGIDHEMVEQGIVEVFAEMLFHVAFLSDIFTADSLRRFTPRESLKALYVFDASLQRGHYTDVQYMRQTRRHCHGSASKKDDVA